MPQGIDDEGNLDDLTLQRFVLQTYGRARRTQDSPIMPDVWLHYVRLAEKIARAAIEDRPRPNDAVDLLLTLWSGVRPGRIAKQLQESLGPIARGKPSLEYAGVQRSAARIALSDRRIVVCANFITLLCYIVPLSGWWQDLFEHDGTFDEVFDRITAHAERPRGRDAELSRYVVLVGFIDCLMRARDRQTIETLGELAYRLGSPDLDEDDEPVPRRPPPMLAEIYQRARRLLWHSVPAAPVAAEAASRPDRGIFLISLNRPATQTLHESRATIKADAAHRLFDINTAGIAFAVIDGGIDATHPAFLDRARKEVAALGSTLPSDSDCLKYSRVKETYDFTRLRRIVDYAMMHVAPVDSDQKPKRSVALSELGSDPDPRDVAVVELYVRFPKAFRHLAIRNTLGRDLDWEIVRPLIRVEHTDLAQYVVPETDHGTHVAGILAADLPRRRDSEPDLYGMCRNLSLYDLRVFDERGRGDEFAILCALEFVGWLNRDRTSPLVHGVNLSLALAHDVDSFACGQTPICETCNHLVGNGTVVVAAAGNTGFDSGGTAEKQSMGNGFRQISITDPGNADLVITVGSTHRRDPHLYGVSYFSARGPTGDGRRKPDLLAPGEKITSTIPRRDIQRMDGTSMAAPHVAGAAAMLMARYPELIGRPLRIKEILMATATDLKREPNFQGAGLVDVLRALQSV
ncbi:MAG: S8 family serine peptidase [Pseudomonadota bacterium]